MNIFAASRRGKTKELESLLISGIDVNEQDHNGVTPLIWASFHGHFNVSKLLLKHGANVTLKDGPGKTALYFANKEEKHNVFLLFQKHSHLFDEEEKQLLQTKTYHCCFGK